MFIFYLCYFLVLREVTADWPLEPLETQYDVIGEGVRASTLELI